MTYTLPFSFRWTLLRTGLRVGALMLLGLGAANRQAEAAASAKTPPIVIWKSERMGFYNGHYFPVSIGKSANPTPTGRYTVKKKVVDYWSKKYDRAMPYSVFFTDAHAIHSGDLYTPSKGCIRVDRSVAPWLFSSAQTGKTRVIIHP